MNLLKILKLKINKNKESHLDLCLNGSKSISNRVLPIAAFINGISYIYNIPKRSEDIIIMINALKDLGINFEQISENENTINYKIFGKNISNINKNVNLYCGNSGTTLRFLTGILAFSEGEYVLSGNSRMHERPIKDLVNALTDLGVQIEYLNNYGYPPIRIIGNLNIRKKIIKVPTNLSSQYISSLLMAMINLKNNTKKKIIAVNDMISKPYVDMTIEILKNFGVQISIYKNIYQITNVKLNTIKYYIEPDASSASYFLAIASINGSCKINHIGKNSIQGDINFINILKQMGAIVEITNNFIKVKKNKPLKAISVDMTDMPDVAMTLAVLALFANGTTYISGISSWKLKETNRIKAMYNELIKFNAQVIITDNSISITPPIKFSNTTIEIDTYDDHRIAMCFSLMAFSKHTIIIKNPSCVNKTFGDYFSFFNDYYNQ